jgi:hypothetical protein
MTFPDKTFIFVFDNSHSDWCEMELQSNFDLNLLGG